MSEMSYFVKTTSQFLRVFRLFVLVVAIGFLAGCWYDESSSQFFTGSRPVDDFGPPQEDPETETNPTDTPVTDTENTSTSTDDSGVASIADNGAFVTIANGKALQSESYSMVVMLGSPVVPRDDDLSQSLQHEIFPWLN